jgi:hypothetical protein
VRRGLTGVGTGAESTHMPGATKKLTVVAVLVVLAVLGWRIHAREEANRLYDELESNARKVITGPELLVWGVALAERYPTITNLTVSQLGTNFPQQLRPLAPAFGPHVTVARSIDSNKLSWVLVYWTQKERESAGFVIGPTKYGGEPVEGHMWCPGVYFYTIP